MYRMLVVDDEELIVNSLCSSIEQNFEVELYRAYSAFEAIGLLQRMRFDLVITDISMPVMSGLELLKRIRGAWPQCYVILLTAYDNFDYAYQSMKFDRVYYLLKVESNSVIHQTIQTVLDKLDSEHSQEQMFIELGEHVEQMKPLMRTDMVSRLLRYGTPLPMQRELDSIGLRLDREKPALMVMGILDAEHYAESTRYLHEITDLAASRLKKRALECQAFLVGYYIVWLMQEPAMPQDETPWLTIIRDAFEDMPDMLEEKSGLRLMLVMDGQTRPLESMNRLFSRMTSVLEQERNGSGMRLISEEPSAEVTDAPVADLSMDDVTLLWDYLKAGSQEAFGQALAERLRPFAAVGDMTSVLPSATVSAVTFLYMSAVNLFGLDRGREVAPAIRGFGHLSGQQWSAEIMRDFDQLFADKAQSQQSGMDWIVTRVQQYIDEHFREDIHLTTIAEAFHYSPSYLSRIFKEATGDSLTGAVNAQRLGYARRLLEHTALPVSDVAHQSGFYSNKYFMQAFKKKTGMTPSQYRKKEE